MSNSPKTSFVRISFLISLILIELFIFSIYSYLCVCFLNAHSNSERGMLKFLNMMVAMSHLLILPAFQFNAMQLSVKVFRLLHYFGVL